MTIATQHTKGTHMQDAHMNTQRRVVTFNVDVAVPFEEAAEFLDALTGNDDDVVLAAEKAMRGRLEDSRSVGDYHDAEIELSIPDEGEVKDALREAAEEQRLRP